MARMDDRLWRRVIELFLMAGEEGDDGSLPDIEDMAWILRETPSELQAELDKLKNIGIISISGGNYFVTKFTERQQPMPKSEYMQRKRNEKQRQEYYQPVTISNADKIRGDKIREEEEGVNNPPTISGIMNIWSGITGFTAFISKSKEDDIQSINALMNNHGDSTIEYCKPFYDEWVRRGYRKTNTAWLDWAITGQIPDIKPKDKDGKIINEDWKKGYEP